MARFILDNQQFTPGDAQEQALLARAHANGKRPGCVCTRPPVPMYVAKINDHYVVKRMPNSGAKHAVTCDSYDPPAALSGLGDVSGSAIQEDPDAGVTNLKLDFALSKTGARAAPVSTGAESASVRTDGKKLTIRGLLHFLWEQAGFNRWSPAMDGKRSWATVRKFVLDAAADKQSKGSALAGQLFVPEPFHPDRKSAITSRRTSAFAPFMPKGTARKLQIVVGEVKDITEARGGFRVIVKHMPDYSFHMNADMKRRLDKRFARELGNWSALDDQGVHLVMIGTFELDTAGNATLDEVALMTTTAQWLPFEDRQGFDLLNTLVDAQRRFAVGLRYNLASDRPLANVVLTDTQPSPVSLYALPADMSGTYHALLCELVGEAEMPAWYWSPALPMPRIPPIEGYAGMPLPAAPTDAAAGDRAEGAGSSADPSGEA